MDKKENQGKIFYKKTLDQDSLAIIMEILHYMRVVISNIRLYPGESEITQKSLATLYSRLTQILEKEKVLDINETDRNMIINGNLITDKDLKDFHRIAFNALIGTMVKSGIKNIVFRKGIAIEEMSYFIKALSEKQWRKPEETVALREELSKKGAIHVAINEREYLVIGSDDLIVQNAKDYLLKKEGKLDEFLNVLGEITEMQFQERDGTIRDDAKLLIAESLIKLKPDMLFKFFSSEEDRVSLDKALFSSLSPEKIKEAILRLSAVYDNLKRSGTPGDDSEPELIKLKQTIELLLDSCKDKDISLEIYGIMMRNGLNELIPSWMGKPALSELELVVSRARALSEKNNEAMIDKSIIDELPEIFIELHKLHKSDLINTLLDKLCKNINAATSDIRSRAVTALSSLSSRSDIFFETDQLDIITANIKKRIDLETDPAIYSELLNILVFVTGKYATSGRVHETGEIISILSDHTKILNKGFVRRPEFAEGALEKISRNELLPILFESLKSLDRKRQTEAFSILSKLDEFGITPLIKELKGTADFSLRQFLAGIFKNIGKSAVTRLIEEINKEISTSELIRIIQIFPTLGFTGIVLEQLKKSLFHFDRRVRVEIILTIPRLETDTSKKGEILKIALKDNDDLVRREAIKALGEIKYIGSVEDLIEIIKPKKFLSKPPSDMIQQAACISLGQIGDKRAVEPLLNILKEKGWFKEEKDSAVKITAIYALKNFKDEEILKIFTRLQEDKDRFISESAKAAIKDYAKSNK